MNRAIKNKGRQKVPMKKMAKHTNLQVTFSKRRSGLFKKASELCALCDADVSLIVFSPADKVYSFGHPNLDSVLNKYLGRNNQPTGLQSDAIQFMEACNRNATLRELNNQVNQVSEQLEAARKHGEVLAAEMEEEQEGCWWRNPVDKMDKDQLELLNTCLDDLSKKVANQAERVYHTSTSLAQLLGPSRLHLDPNIAGFLPPPELLDEFDQKNFLAHRRLPPPPPPPPLSLPAAPADPVPAPADPILNLNMNMEMDMNDPNMSNLVPNQYSYDNLDPAHFNPFSPGFF